MLCHIYIGRCYALADVIVMDVVGDGKPQRQVLLPLLYIIKVADVIANILFVAGGRPLKLHVTAFEDGRCYCRVVDGITTVWWVNDNW